MDDHAAQLRSCMYQYSRAIYRSIKDLIDPYASREEQLDYRRAVLEECEETARLWLGCEPQPAPLSPAQIDELRREFGARW